MNHLKTIKIQIAIVFIAVFSFAQIVKASPITSQNIIDLTNKTRIQNGFNELNVSPELSNAASDKARDMVEKNYWSHKTIEGYPFWIFVDNKNYQWNHIGENIAADYKTSEGAINGWFESPSHQKNILNSDYQDIGVGVYKNIVVAYYGKPAVSTNYIDKITQILSNFKIQILGP
jgi:uncharacterized protein YkwD